MSETETVSIPNPGGELLDLPELPRDTPVSPSVAIGALALNFAMKYCDITTVQDGQLYQQYKLEGKNMLPMNLHYVFEVAAQIEQHLMQTSERIAAVVCDAIEAAFTEEDEASGEALEQAKRDEIGGGAA